MRRAGWENEAFRLRKRNDTDKLFAQPLKEIMSSLVFVPDPYVQMICAWRE